MPPSGMDTDTEMRFVSPAMADIVKHSCCSDIALECIECPVALGGVQRTEHCFVSKEVVAVLGLQYSPEVRNYGQIRVYRHSDKPNNRMTTMQRSSQCVNVVNTVPSYASCALFTVAKVLAGTPGRVIQIMKSQGGQPGGDVKLVAAAKGEPETAQSVRRLGLCDACCPVSSSLTVRGHDEDDTVYEEIPIFIESIRHISFQEHIFVGSNRIILIAPHGGGMESKTSEQIRIITNLLNRDPVLRNASPTYWECRGRYIDNKSKYKARAQLHFHITSCDINKSSFPGLNWVQSTVPPYDKQALFQYCVALHGYASDDAEDATVVIGGQASLEEKELVRHCIMSRTGDAVTCLVSHTEPQAPIAASVKTPTKGKKKSKKEEPSMTETSKVIESNTEPAGRDVVKLFCGMQRSNIVNRLSPNPHCVRGRGAFQFEQSRVARDDYYIAVAEGISDAMRRLLNASCAQREAGGKAALQQHTILPAILGAS